MYEYTFIDDVCFCRLVTLSCHACKQIYMGALLQVGCFIQAQPYGLQVCSGRDIDR